MTLQIATDNTVRVTKSVVGTVANVKATNTGTGKPVQNFGLFPKQPEYEGQVYNIEAFGATVTVSQGDLVRVTGSFDIQNWKDSQGADRTNPRIRTNGRGVFVLSRKGEGKKTRAA